jgi:hypothetical protein
LCALVRGKFCHRLAAKHGLCPNDAWEGSDLGVVGAHRVNVITACYGNTIFGAFQLRLQRQKIRVRFQVGVVFDNR